MGLLQKNVHDVNELVNIICSHIKGVCLEYNNIIRVYPTLTISPPVVYASASPMVLGIATIIVPSNTITKDFRIIHINVGDVSQKDTYELHLFANDNIIGTSRIRKDNTIANSQMIPINSKIIESNSEISIKIASITGGGNMAVSIAYKQGDIYF